MIFSLNDIQNLLINGFDDWKSLGNVYTKEFDDLVLFNYSPLAQYEANWNYLERVSRGLILNKITGEVVARPFDKFFNWGEGDRYTTFKIKTVKEKIDGSLGILYRKEGRHFISTRGSFNSEQADWANEYIKRYDFTYLPEEMTLLFEIVYPENRIVVDYGDREDLVLLHIRNRFTSNYYSYKDMISIAHAFGLNLVTLYDFENTDDILSKLSKLDSNSEGWVAEFEDGQFFKFKGDEYCKLHKLISGLTFKNTLEYVKNNDVKTLLANTPDEFLEETKQWLEDIYKVVKSTENKVEAAFAFAPKSSRKTFALWVNENYKDLSPYLFAKLDCKPYENLIYKLEF